MDSNTLEGTSTAALSEQRFVAQALLLAQPEP
jgi:hypothetical protein